YFLHGYCLCIVLLLSVFIGRCWLFFVLRGGGFDRNFFRLCSLQKQEVCLSRSARRAVASSTVIPQIVSLAIILAKALREIASGKTAAPQSEATRYSTGWYQSQTRRYLSQEPRKAARGPNRSIRAQ